METPPDDDDVKEELSPLTTLSTSSMRRPRLSTLADLTNVILKVETNSFIRLELEV